MKKLIISLMLSISVFLTGCANKTEDKKKISLNDAYFSIVDEVKNNGEIKEEDLKKLLDGYEYHYSSRNDEDYDYVNAESHNFIDGNKKLTVVNEIMPDESKSVSVSYEISEFENSIQVTYAPPDESISDSVTSFYTNITVDNKDLEEKISKIVDVKDSSLISIYNKISEDLLDSKDIVLDDIQNMTNITPETEEAYDQIKYSFMEDDIFLVAYCEKGQDRINRICYDNDYKRLFKSVSVAEGIEGGTRISNMLVGLNGIDKQKELIKVINEYK